MGGGGSSTGQPYDLLGGQYASFSGGTPGYDWSALGKGIAQGAQSFGKGIAGAQTPIPSPQDTQIAPAEIGSNQSQPAYIQQNNLIEALLRLLGGGQG